MDQEIDYTKWCDANSFRLLVTWDGLPETQLDLVLDKKIAKQLINRAKYMHKRALHGHGFESSYWTDLEWPMIYMEFYNQHWFEQWFMNKRELNVVYDSIVDGRERIIDVDHRQFYMNEYDGRWYLTAYVTIEERHHLVRRWANIRHYCKTHGIKIEIVRNIQMLSFSAVGYEPLDKLVCSKTFNLEWCDKH